MNLERAILEYLASKEIFHYRQPKGVSDGFGGYRVGPKGGPIIICVIKGQYVAIAVKSGGTKQTDSQKVFQEALEKAGGKYVLASTLADVTEALREPSTDAQSHGPGSNN